jgi:hypothetical protein
MTGRLSEAAVIQTLDGGWQSLLRANIYPENSVASGVDVDFKAILDAKDPVTAAQSIGRRDMVLALLATRPEDALEVLPLLSQEQFLAVIDSEGWQDGRLAIHQVMRWLDLYRHLGPEHLYRRFRELDEEYQVALLNPYVELVDEESFEKLSQDDQDKFNPMPCNTMWWRIKDGDDKVQEFVRSLIEASIGEDAAYVYSLLGMASMLPPNEQEDLIKQFRDARLEEDGFVTREESLQLFHKFDGEALLKRWNDQVTKRTTQSLANTAGSNDLFLDRVLRFADDSGQVDLAALDQMRRSFAYLANALSAAANVTPDDGPGLVGLLRQVKFTVSYGLEILSGGDQSKGMDILFSEYPKTLFRFALSTVDTLRSEVLVHLRTLNPDAAGRLESLWVSGKFGAALWFIDQQFLDALGFEASETLKGIFNRFPMVKDQVIDNDHVKRVKFRPISTKKDFSELLTEVRRIFNVSESGSVIQ